jgi:hypothetical protein
MTRAELERCGNDYDHPADDSTANAGLGKPFHFNVIPKVSNFDLPGNIRAGPVVWCPSG